MFNHTSLDKVCVQATHLEARGKNTFDALNEGSDFKSKGRKRIENSRKEKGKFFCKNCSKTSHDEDHYWKLHPELKLEKYKNKDKTKEKGKIVATFEQDLGSKSGDETKSISMVLKNIKGKEVLQETNPSSSTLNCHKDTQMKRGG